VPQHKQLAPAASQFPRQLLRANTLSNAAQDQHQLRTGTMGALQDRIGETIKHSSAPRTLIIDQRLPVPTVDSEMVHGTTTRASQTIGVQQMQELAVTGLLVHEVLNRKVHWLLREQCTYPAPAPQYGTTDKSTAEGP
jgi:hypothetical protein